MTCIDATAGNGNDTLFLAKCVLTPNSGWVHAFDIQADAIITTQERLTSLPLPLQKRITLHEASHETFPPNISPSLIVYNLGYLPGGDLDKTTLSESTLKSCENAIRILSHGGLLSITIYPGHPEGLREKSTLLGWIESLSDLQIFHHTPINRPNQPSLIMIRKY
ncbi:MAG: class I SAM-dependent methyltransferase [Chlamydiae bacterium]|nr:class I SAM-dependent methyltransferase [Chlamydiota bacterium]